MDVGEAQGEAFLGDSLMEAESLACPLSRLADKGFVIYGDAKAFSQKAKRILDG